MNQIHSNPNRKKFPHLKGKINKRKSSRSEKGVALIIVLSIISISAIFAISAVSFSQKANYLSASFSQKALSSYIAEGATARIQWLIMNDRRKFPQRAFGAERLDTTVERYMADGSTKKMNYYGHEIQYKIFDSASGLNISGANPRVDLEKSISLYDEEIQKTYKELINRIEDYIDSNDLLRANGGMEAKEYQEIGLYPLPRNRPLEFKEEILWIPGALQFFQPDSNGRLSQIRTIAPRNMPKIGTQNNFFSVDINTIMTLCGVSESEAQRILQARANYLTNGTPLEESLDPGTYTLLRSKFSFTESGFYSIEVDGSSQINRAGKKLFTVVRIANQMTPPGIRYYEWFSY